MSRSLAAHSGRTCTRSLHQSEFAPMTSKCSRPWNRACSPTIVRFVSMGSRSAISRACAMAWRVFPDVTSWTIARHNITLDGEKNTFVPSPPTSSRNSLKANRVLGEHEDPVMSEARTADDFRTNGHGMGVPPSVYCEQPAECTPISRAGDLAIPIFFALSAKALQPNSGPITGNPESILKLALTGLSRLRRGLGIENDFSQRVKLRKDA